jgi:hypothetical protein
MNMNTLIHAPEGLAASNITFDTRTWGESPPHTPGPDFLARLRKFNATYKQPRSRRKQVRQRKQRNRIWRHTRWLLSRARRGKGNGFYSRLHLQRATVYAVATGMRL